MICQVKENGVEGENHVAADGELEEGEIAEDDDSRYTPQSKTFEFGNDFWKYCSEFSNCIIYIM